MAALSEIISHIYEITRFYLSLLLLQLIILTRSITTRSSYFITTTRSSSSYITTSQYLNLIEQQNPTTQFMSTPLRHPQYSSFECAVCLSEFSQGETLRKLRCKHTFHRDCLDKWLQECFATCPLCRTKVLPDEVVANYHRLHHRNNDHDYYYYDQFEYDGSDEEIVHFFSALHGFNRDELVACL